MIKPIELNKAYYVEINNKMYKVDKNFTAPTLERKEGYYYIVKVNKHKMGAPRYLKETLNTYLLDHLGYVVYDRTATTDISKAARFYIKDCTKEDVIREAKRYIRHLRTNREFYNRDNPSLTQIDDLELIKKRCHYHKRLEK